MSKKSSLTFMAFLLVAIPFLGVFARDTYAATSRVGIIKELTGTVEVKKSGGTKQFKAYKKMSLNEGDVLTVGPKSSAVLQFSNGSSEDDRVTAGAGSTLTFSKLTDRGGTTTKISLLSGTTWSEIKSIKSKDDAFTIETPTAIMGVRGTHLFATVDPLSGSTLTMVASGFANVAKKTNGSARPNGGNPTTTIYPTQQIIVDVQGSSQEMDDSVTFLDVDEIINHASPEVIEQFIRNKAQIDKENEELIKKKKADLESLLNRTPGLNVGSPEELDKLMKNVSNLIGALAKDAIDKGKLTAADIERLAKEAGTSIDLRNTELELSKLEQDKLNKEKEKLAELQKKKQEEAKKEKEKLNEQVQAALEAQRRAQEAANKAAESEIKKKALEEYERQLSELEKKRLEQDRQTNGEVVPSPTTGTGSGTGNGGSSAFYGIKYNIIGSGTANEWVKALPFGALQSDYSLEVPFGAIYAVVSPRLNATTTVSTVRYSEDGGESEMSYYATFDETMGGYIVPLIFEHTYIAISGIKADNSSVFVGVALTKRDQPEGLASSSQQYNELSGSGITWNPFEWEYGYGGIFGARVPSESTDLKWTLQLTGGAVKAVVKQITYSGSETEVLSPVTMMSNVETLFTISSKYDYFLVELFDANNHQVGHPIIYWLIDDDIVFGEDDHPFDLKDSSGNAVDYRLGNSESRGFQARVDASVNELRFYSAEGTDLTLEKAIVFEESDYNSDEYYPNNAGVITVPLTNESTSLMVEMKDIGGGSHYYDLIVHRYDLPQGVADWHLIDDLDEEMIWEQARNLPSGSPKRFVASVSGDSSWTDLHFDPTSGSELKLYDSYGELVKTFTAEEPEYRVEFNGNGYYRFKLMNGTKATEFVIERGFVSSQLDENEFLINQAGNERVTIPTYNYEGDDFEKGFAVVTDDIANPIMFALDSDFGDIELRTDNSAVHISEPDGDGYRTLNFSEPGTYDVSVEVHSPLDYSDATKYLLTVYYGSVPAAIDLTPSQIAYAGGTVNSVTYLGSYTYQINMTQGLTQNPFVDLTLSFSGTIKGFSSDDGMTASQAGAAYILYGVQAGASKSIYLTVENGTGHRITYVLIFQVGFPL
ncbi:FecR domain-containing protein [Cohnella faecalis]|uniref:FecR protein domain-containing protein n=1 Tax=Cohnella faecalis TaxID=2315694 RepID=A0A398CBU1_9BACL|nr:FecR domain-containing protein [Cohnella faecalis]RIE00626.1 hypothetical protein D3H35_27045 [Cohnella faecalis]